LQEELLEGLLSPLAHRAVPVDRLGDRAGVPGVRPPLAGRLTGPRNHRREQHELGDRQPRRHNRPGERAERLRDDDELRLDRHGTDHRGCVVGGRCRLVVDWQRRREALLPQVAQRVDRGAVDPRVGAGAENHDERRHYFPPRSLLRRAWPSAASAPG